MDDEQSGPKSPVGSEAATRIPKIRMRHFSRSLPMLLLRSRESVMRHFRKSLRDYDMTEQQWRILRALTNVSEIDVTDLARATFLLGPSLSRILKDLEARGLVERRPNAHDQRRAGIAITIDGLELIARASPHSEAIYQEITRAFGEEKLQQLQSLLEDLEKAMQGVDLPAPAEHREE